MRHFEYPEAKSVVVCGDIHGDFHTLVHKLCVQCGMADTLLIVAGDCGFGFDKPAYYEQVYGKDAGRLRKSNNWIAFVRGNHDNPAYFNEERITYKRWRRQHRQGIPQKAAGKVHPDPDRLLLAR